MREIRRQTWLVTLAAAAILLAGTGYWGYTQFNQKRILLTQLNNRNQKAFFELVGNVENMEVLLAKSLVSSSEDQRRILYSDLWQHAYSAQANLGTMPIAQWNIGRTARFLTQTGDFAYSIVKNGEGNSPNGGEEVAQLQELHKEARGLVTELQRIRVQAADGLLTWREVEGQAPKIKRANNTFTDGFVKINKQLQEYPTLIYDGPFSDHIEQRKPKGLTGKEITAEEAQKIAARFLSQGNRPLFVANRVTEIAGRIPGYRVHFEPGAGTGPVAVVDVSRKGGHVLMMIVKRDSGTRVTTLKEAETKAAAYLKNQGYPTMEATDSLVQADTAIISYAYQQDGTLVYPDLVKVKVALDNGDIIGLDALDYVMSHHKRNISQPKVSKEEAQKKLSPRFNVREARSVIIPTESLRELQAYEFKGDFNGDPFIIYVNAMTGKEEKVLKVIETKDGPMTM